MMKLRLIALGLFLLSTHLALCQEVFLSNYITLEYWGEQDRAPSKFLFYYDKKFKIAPFDPDKENFREYFILLTNQKSYVALKNVLILDSYIMITVKNMKVK